MPKTKVSADRLAEELNKSYALNPKADGRNRFHAHPHGATGRNITGYSTVGLWTPAHQSAWNAVHNEFELDIDGV